MSTTDTLLSTRDLARQWIAAVAEGGLGGAKALALVSPDFVVNAPRSMSPYLGGAGLATPRDKLAGLDAAVRAVFDMAAFRGSRGAYDIFSGDQGGAQYRVTLKPRGGGALETVLALSFVRSGGVLSAVWLHADTSDIKAALDGAA